MIEESIKEGHGLRKANPAARSRLVAGSSRTRTRVAEEVDHGRRGADPVTSGSIGRRNRMRKKESIIWPPAPSPQGDRGRRGYRGGRGDGSRYGGFDRGGRGAPGGYGDGDRRGPRGGASSFEPRDEASTSQRDPPVPEV
uniref:Uncharacterized protein n=1 Tax=Steinernema glaseri TaxID=37863 RepID=A0A1I7YDX7_9BILA